MLSTPSRIPKLFLMEFSVNRSLHILQTILYTNTWKNNESLQHYNNVIFIFYDDHGYKYFSTHAIFYFC